MGKTLSGKQLKANRQNAKKGGVKTPEGKEISKYNSIKHGILSDVITEYDKGNFTELHQRLIEELCPEIAIEEILVERMVLYIIRLYRVAKAETEYMKKILNPEIGHWEGHPPQDPFEFAKFEEQKDTRKWVVDKKGYELKIGSGNIVPLEDIYFRYEKSLENRLYRAMQELQNIRRARRGDKISLPVTSDIETESS